MTAIVLNKLSMVLTDGEQTPSYSHDLTSNLIRKVPFVYANQKCKDTLRVLFAHPEAECIVVCNKAYQPVGIVNCGTFYLRIIGVMGMDSLYMEPINKLMKRYPIIVEEGMQLQSIREKITSRKERNHEEHIIVMKHGKLSGVIKGSDLMSL
jgi:signal-transduction protein with cAMP-binding, CBS, and nucleotidyltransferase domain